MGIWGVALQIPLSPERHLREEGVTWAAVSIVQQMAEHSQTEQRKGV